MQDNNSKNIADMVRHLSNANTLDVMLYYNSMWKLINESTEDNAAVLEKIQNIKDSLIEEGLMADDGSDTRDNLESLLELYHNEYNIRRQN